MRKRFSERYGFIMDDGLRNRLLNKFKEFYIDSISTKIVNLQFIYVIKFDKDKDFFFNI